jgi:hypothetical protein
MILKLIFVENSVLKTLIITQLYGLPHGILNEFQNPQILMDTLEITFSCLTLVFLSILMYVK